MDSLEGTKGKVDLSQLIREFRGCRVMLDSDLARIYGVSTRQLNQAVRRNRCRFPREIGRHAKECAPRYRVAAGERK